MNARGNIVDESEQKANRRMSCAEQGEEKAKGNQRLG